MINQYRVSASIENIEELKNFAQRIKEMPECKSLTSEEKLNIIFAYQIKMNFKVK